MTAYDGWCKPLARRLYVLLARLSASNSTARSVVTASTVSPRRKLAFVSPSVTYGPKRPSFRTIVTSRCPDRRRAHGAVRALRPRPRLRGGSAKRALASSSVTVKSCSSDSSERDSEPFFT